MKTWKAPLGPNSPQNTSGSR